MNNLFYVDNKWLMRYIIIIMAATPILNNTKTFKYVYQTKVLSVKGIENEHL